MDSHKRSIAKSLSWRVFAVFITGIIALIITKKASFAITMGLVDSATKLLVYYLHERIWDKIHFGRKACPPQQPEYEI